MTKINLPKTFSPIRVVFRIAGVTAISLGAFMSVFGFFWATWTMQVFSDNPLGPVLAYFVPFLPIFLMLSGAYLLTNSRGR